MLVSISTGVEISFCIETVQIITSLGSFHLDDITANLIGCLVGVVIATFFSRQNIKRSKRKNNAY